MEIPYNLSCDGLFIVETMHIHMRSSLDKFLLRVCVLATQTPDARRTREEASRSQNARRGIPELPPPQRAETHRPHQCVEELRCTVP